MTRRKTYLEWALINMCVLLVVIPAAAADTGGVPDEGERPEDREVEVDAEDIQRAQEHFDEGASYFYEESYGRAIIEFRRAHELHPHPIFLHNIARAHQELGRIDRTLDAAERAEAMGEQMPEEVRPVNQALIVGLTAVLDAEEIADDMAVTIAAEDEDIDDEKTDEDLDDVDRPQPVSRWGGLGWTGAVVSGVGVVGLLGAAFVDRHVQNEWDDLLAASEGSSEAEFTDRRQALSSRQSTGKAMLFTGAGLLAVGSGLMIWELSTSPSGSKGVSVSPSATRVGADVFVRW